MTQILKNQPSSRTRLPGGYDLALKFSRNAVTTLYEMAHKYGDSIHHYVAPFHIYQFNHPDQIKEVLVNQQRNFGKGASIQVLRRLLGDGLLTNQGDDHLRQRRLLQPIFHKRTIAGFADTMVEYSFRQSQTWQPGQTVNINGEMKAITLPIVAKTLFSAELQNQPTVAQAMSVLQVWSQRTLLPPYFGTLLNKIPLPLTRRFNRATSYLDNLLYTMLRERRNNPAQAATKNDLMTMLLQTEDENGVLSDKQIRDELMTFFLAGDETTSTGLTWAWYLLSQHPEVEAKLHAEVDAVLGGNAATVDDVPKLTYTQKVIKEVWRLYPPAYVYTRSALNDCVIGDFSIKQGSLVMVSPYVVQRDARYYEQPELFNPDRWTPEFEANLSKFAYFPFGQGTRRCIGEEFARVESILVLATLAQKWQLQLAPGYHLEIRPRLVLIPKKPIPMIVQTRSPWVRS